MERRGRRGSDQELRLPGVGKGAGLPIWGLAGGGPLPKVVSLSRASYQQPNRHLGPQSSQRQRSAGI
jgi:hypothetical protein